MKYHEFHNVTNTFTVILVHEASIFWKLGLRTADPEDAGGGEKNKNKIHFKTKLNLGIIHDIKPLFSYFLNGLLCTTVFDLCELATNCIFLIISI